jgi:hypothetical protein
MHTKIFIFLSYEQKQISSGNTSTPTKQTRRDKPDCGLQRHLIKNKNKKQFEQCTYTHTPSYKKKKQVSMRFSSFINIFIPNADSVHPQSSHTKL